MEALEETRVDVGLYGFWKQGTTTLFDVKIVSLDAVSYLFMLSEKVLEKAKKYKK